MAITGNILHTTLEAPEKFRVLHVTDKLNNKALFH
jgi:hypothetical protein